MFGLTFAAPLALAALIGLPALWILLRVTPPRPRRIDFPPLKLVADLIPQRQTPARTPPWLLICACSSPPRSSWRWPGPSEPRRHRRGRGQEAPPRAPRQRFRRRARLARPDAGRHRHRRGRRPRRARGWRSSASRSPSPPSRRSPPPPPWNGCAPSRHGPTCRPATRICRGSAPSSTRTRRRHRLDHGRGRGQRRRALRQGPERPRDRRRGGLSVLKADRRGPGAHGLGIRRAAHRPCAPRGRQRPGCRGDPGAGPEGPAARRARLHLRGRCPERGCRLRHAHRIAQTASAGSRWRTSIRPGRVSLMDERGKRRRSASSSAAPSTSRSRCWRRSTTTLPRPRTLRGRAAGARRGEPVGFDQPAPRQSGLGAGAGRCRRPGRQDGGAHR